MFIGLFLFSFVTFSILTFIDSTDYISKHDAINWVDEDNEEYYGIGEQVKRRFKRNDFSVGVSEIKKNTISAINKTSLTPTTKNASIMVNERNANLDKNLIVKLKPIVSNKRKKRSNVKRSTQGKAAHKRKQTTKPKRRPTTKHKKKPKRRQTTKRRTTPKRRQTTKRKTTPKKKLTTKRRTTLKQKLTTKRRTTPKQKLTTKHRTTPNQKLTTKPRTTPQKIPMTTTIETTTSSINPSSETDINLLRKEYLDQTNEYRRLHGSPDLTNSQKLEDLAQAYAEKLANEMSGQLIHDPNSPYGENLAYLPSTMINDPVKLWYDEVKNYDFSNPGFSMNTGHFTQLVWKNTKEMGCVNSYNFCIKMKNFVTKLSYLQ
uniref:CAP domain-containing protein (inferred by orthology to a human protein) n=1 Tax=Strongyloides venezuelensis TaxID=75913 RepID=A0A0K0G1S8_STRVS